MKLYLLGMALVLLLSSCGNGEQAGVGEPAPSISTSSEANDPQVQETERPGGGGAAVSDEEQILAVYERMQQAMVDKDTDTLREMMGADTTVRHITGRTQTMDEWLSDVENEEMKYYSIEVTEPEIVIDGDTATLTCSNVIDARIYGSRGTWTLSGGAAFEKINGEWVMAYRSE